MSPLSGPVLMGAALVSSPAVYHAIEGTAPVEVALVRFLISVVLCWLALDLVTSLIGPTPRPQGPEGSLEGAAAGSDEVGGLDKDG